MYGMCEHIYDVSAYFFKYARICLYAFKYATKNFKFYLCINMCWKHAVFITHLKHAL